MDSNAKIYKSNEFEVTLHKTDKSLSIKAFNTAISKSYSIKILQKAVNGITNGIFSDIQSLHEGLIEAFEGGKEVSILITKEGKFIYTCLALIGKTKREFTFDIQLEESSSDPLKKLETKLDKLSAKVLALEQSTVNQTEILGIYITKQIEQMLNERLDSFELKIEKKLLDFETKLASLSQIPQYIPQYIKQPIEIIQPKQETPMKFTFDHATVNRTNFTLSNKNKTATKTNMDSYVKLFAREPLKEGLCSFSVKLEVCCDKSSKNPWGLIGIAPPTYAQTAHLTSNETAGGTWFYGVNGYIFKNNITISSKLEASKNGDIITVKIDMERGVIIVMKNNVHICTGDLEKEYFEAHEYFPCIELFHGGSKVTFVDK